MCYKTKKIRCYIRLHHQDHYQMNTFILNDAHGLQQQNDQKITIRTHAN
jgi:hypothetical protein